MYKFRISKVAPFWARNNENKPNKEIFEKWLNDNMVEIENPIINFLNFSTFTLNTEYNGIKYIEVVNELDSNDVRYYYVDGVELNGANNTYRYRGVIDIYTSFTLKFIYDNLDKEFVFIRKHDYDKKALQIEDSNISSIPKLYKNFYFKKVLFNYDEGNKIWYGKNIGLNGDDLLNANKYYVFKDGANGGYRFYPILSKSLDAKVIFSKQVAGKLSYTGMFWNGRYRNYVDNINNLKVDIPSIVNSKIVDAYTNNKIIKYFYRTFENKKLTNWIEIKNIPYGTLPIDIVVNTQWYNHAGIGIRRIKQFVYMLGNQVFSKESGNFVAWEFGTGTSLASNVRELKVEIYDNKPETTFKNVKNSITGLEQLRRKEENINKFLGVYYLPHFLNFSKFDNDGDYIFVNIDPKGDNIELFKIYDYTMSNITDMINNTSYSTPYLLRYLQIKYYGNRINAEYRVNDMNSIFIGGKLFFTDTCNIISKSDDLISLEKSIVTYPYQLPIGVDTYEQYVKANRGVTDTSFSIAKQQQDIQFAKSIFGGVMGVGKVVGKAVTGDYMGAITGAINVGADLGFGIAGQFQGINQMEQKIQAQYQQANNTMGNEIQFSNIQNASLTEYYDSDSGEQFEGVEVSDLDKSTLALINNYILLNGYLNPEKDKLTNRVVNERLFNYIQLDATLLLNVLNIVYDSKKYNNDIYKNVINQLTNGVRIWNREGEMIPEYDENTTPWPDQPVRPEIPKPLPPEVPQNLTHEKNLFGTSYYDYYDRTSLLKRGGCLLRVNENDENYVGNIANSNNTSCRGASYYSGITLPKNKLDNPTINIISKYGACKFQYGEDNDFALVVGKYDPTGLIVKLTIPEIDSTFTKYIPLFDGSKNPPVGGFTGLGRVAEVWLNGVKVWPKN